MVYGDGELNSVDQMSPGDEQKNFNQIEKVQGNFDYNQSQSYIHNPMNDESVEIELNRYPRIDGIRRELIKLKEEDENIDNEDINEMSILNNASQNLDLNTLNAAPKSNI